jgi:1-deoxy-D-xylulose-5-phosphate synthase
MDRVAAARGGHRGVAPVTPHALLGSIGRPQDLHRLSRVQLQQVAQEIREELIDTIGEVGGHFGANLGTCELAVAIHSVIDSPRDKVLWDVGHQAYPHKILTGRREALKTIRKHGGLAPFCSIFESEHDVMGAGHASTSCRSRSASRRRCGAGSLPTAMSSR